MSSVLQERKFLEQQSEGMDKAMKRLADQHREKVALLERQFLQQKQQLLRGTAPFYQGTVKCRFCTSSRSALMALDACVS